MKRILLYDTWPNLFDKLHQVFGKLESVEITYVCNSSLFLKYSSPQTKDRFADTIVSYIDFAEYEYSVEKILKALDIDMVLFISIHNPEQRFFNYAARKLGYKTALLMHGAIFKDQIIVKSKNKLINKISRLPYYLFFLRKIGAALPGSKKPVIIRELFDLATRPSAYKNTPRVKEAVGIDALMYCNDHNVHFYQHYTDSNFKSLKVHSLDYLEYVASNSQIDNGQNAKDRVLFLGQPIRELGTTVALFANTVAALKEQLEVEGKELLIKYHPRQDVRIDNIIEEEEPSLIKLVSQYDYFVSISSTALILPARIGKKAIGLSKIFSLESLGDEQVVELEDVGQIRQVFQDQQMPAGFLTIQEFSEFIQKV